jgi:hypothetical protein
VLEGPNEGTIREVAPLAAPQGGLQEIIGPQGASTGTSAEPRAQADFPVMRISHCDSLRRSAKAVRVV